jgi:tetratricopeptide (TPR) repeat protein
MASARLSRSEVLTLVEAAKLVAARLDRVEAADPAVDATRSAVSMPADLFDAALVDEPVYLAALLERIDDRIRERLREQTLQWSTLQALGTVKDCVLASVPRCLRIEAPVLAWLELAAVSRRVLPEGRAIALFRLAQLHAGRNRVAEALLALEQAEATYPAEVQHLFSRIELLIRSGELDAAERALDRARARAGPFGARAGELDILAQWLAEARAAGPAGEAGSDRP